VLLGQAGTSSVNRLNPLIALGRVRALRGQEGVWDCLDELAAAADTLDEPEWTVAARTLRTEARWLEGDDDGALAELEVADAAARDGGQQLRAEVQIWRHRLGGEVAPEPLPEPYASQVAGDWVKAAQLWDERGFAYEAALALMQSGDEALMRDALGRLDAIGAVAVARLVRQRLRGMGVKSIPAGVRSTTREHPAGLTRREREVLELVCDGQTNDQISQRLFISVKTVDHHVSAVLGKLGVSSRRSAAAEAARLGLVPAGR
jgi:DNA-binding CsgD family transcriptional regulator